MEKTLKWSGFVVQTLCMLTTSLMMIPANLFFGALAGVLWTTAGVVTNDTPLWVSSLVAVGIFVYGIAIYFL